MHVHEAITTRRSIRSFLDQEVEPNKLEAILAAAVHAPSSGNTQPWHFHILDNRDLIGRCCRLNLDALWGVHAPAAILVCSNSARHRKEDFWVQDCAAVTQNILLLAHAIGLGTTWTGIYPKIERVEGIRRILYLPESIIPVSLVLIGYPKVQGKPKEHPLMDRLCYNRYADKPETAYAFSSAPPDSTPKKK